MMRSRFRRLDRPILDAPHQAAAFVADPVQKQVPGERTTTKEGWTNRGPLQKAGNIILVKPIRGCTALKSWAMRIARRAGPRKAKVALARKLAVILHRMLADGQPFDPAAAAA